MRFKKAILFLLTAALLLSFAAPSFAFEFENEDAPTVEELARFAEEADWFLNISIFGALLSYYHELDQKQWDDPSNEFCNWTKEWGYVGTRLEKNPHVDDDLYMVNTYTGERTPLTKEYVYSHVVAFHEDLTLEKIQKDLKSFFAYDSFFEHKSEYGNEVFIEDSDGRLYNTGHGRSDTWITEIDDWDEFWYGAKITAQKKNWIETTMSANGIVDTIEYTKTANGWRISGGSYFKAYYDFGDYTPPEAGDSTAPYLTLAALSLFSLTLAGAAAMVRKRREAL